MKLYTEDDVRKAIELARDVDYDGTNDHTYSEEEIVAALNPIELPSDEEIGKGREINITIDKVDMWLERLYFTIGAKWMRDKIQGGNQ
jgi:hypothetical protein